MSISTVEVRSMHTAIHELIVCRSPEDAKAVRYAVSILSMNPLDANKYEAVGDLDMSIQVDRNIFWNQATDGKYHSVIEVDFRTKSADGSYTVDGHKYLTVNLDNDSMDFYWS